jgi:hypothetical protein
MTANGQQVKTPPQTWAEVPSYSLRKTYATPERHEAEGYVFAEAAAYLDQLPAGLQPERAAEVVAKLFDLIYHSGEEREVKRAFAAYATRQGWLNKYWSVEDVFKDAKRFCEEEEREEELTFKFGLAGTQDGPGAEPLCGGLLRAGLATVIGGPFKTCKTLFGLALAVHLANGTPFLGHAVPRKLRVAFIAGESTEDALQAAAQRVAHAIGGSLDGLELFTALPPMGSKKNRDDLAFLTRRRKWHVLFLDPTYRLLGGKVDISSIYSTGARLHAVAKVVQDRGCTPVFLHHSNRSLAPGRPMELGDLLGAGTAEFFRGWLLLNRATPFDHARPGRHDLFLTHGNCQGDAGRLRLALDEGLDGVPWALTARPCGEAEAEKTARYRGTPAERVMTAMADLAPRHGGRVPRTKLGKAADCTGSNLTAVLRKLAGEGRVVVEEESFNHKGRPAKRHFVRAGNP